MSRTSLRSTRDCASISIGRRQGPRGVSRSMVVVTAVRMKGKANGASRGVRCSSRSWGLLTDLYASRRTASMCVQLRRPNTAPPPRPVAPDTLSALADDRWLFS